MKGGYTYKSTIVRVDMVVAEFMAEDAIPEEVGLVRRFQHRLVKGSPLLLQIHLKIPLRILPPLRYKRKQIEVKRASNVECRRGRHRVEIQVAYCSINPEYIRSAGFEHASKDICINASHDVKVS